MAAARVAGGIDLRRITAADERSLEEITKFAESHNYPSPFQSGAMFSVYSKTKKCRPLGFIARDDQGGLLGSLIATTFMDAGVFAGKVVNHVSCRGGPLFTPVRDGMTAGNLLISKLLDAAKEKSLYTRFYPLFDQPDQLSLLTSAGFVREDWLNYFVDLTLGKKALWEKMSKHRRKGIRRAEHLGLEVVDCSSMGDVDTLYGLLMESHNQAMIPLQDKSMFEAMQRTLVQNKMVKMVMAFRGEKPIAARIALTFSGVIYDWYAGSVPEAEEANANEFLVWRLMTWGLESGYRLLDFGGAGLPEEEYGPREFKRRFGGQLTNLGRYTIVHKPKMLKLIQNLYKVRRRI